MTGYVDPPLQIDAAHVLRVSVLAAALPDLDPVGFERSRSVDPFWVSTQALRELEVRINRAIRIPETFAGETLSTIAILVASYPVLLPKADVIKVPGTGREWSRRVAVRAAVILVDELSRRTGRRLDSGGRTRLERLIARSGISAALVADSISKSVLPLDRTPVVLFHPPAGDVVDTSERDRLHNTLLLAAAPLRELGFQTVGPHPQFGPEDRDDNEPRAVYRRERRIILEADVLVVFVDRYNSPGCIRAVTWAEQNGAVVLVFSRDNAGLSRVTSAGPYGTRYFNNLSEDEIAAEVRRACVDNRRYLLALSRERERRRSINLEAIDRLVTRIEEVGHRPAMIQAARIADATSDIGELDNLTVRELRALIAYLGYEFLDVLDMLLEVRREAIAKSRPVNAVLSPAEYDNLNFVILKHGAKRAEGALMSAIAEGYRRRMHEAEPGLLSAHVFWTVERFEDLLDVLRSGSANP